ncbi:MAG TPA: AAA family ATPase [Polyangiaceae bacterium]|nr:AAA family ATPase [Polyangiaceae bacterium]
MTRRRMPANPDVVQLPKPAAVSNLFISLNDETDEIGTERLWFAEGIIEGAAPLALIVGPEKSGKSWALTDLVVATVAGGDWLGCFPVRRTGSVLLVEAEQGAYETKRRLMRVARGRGLDPGEVNRGVRYVRGYWQLDALDNDEMRDLKRYFDENGEPALVVIDPLRGTMLGDENSAKDVLAALEGAAQLGRIAGAPVVVAHHVNKSGAASGSRALATRPDLILTGTDSARPRYTAVGRRIRRNDPIADGRGFHIDVDHGEHDDDDTQATTIVKAVFGEAPAPLPTGPLVLSAAAERVLKALKAGPRTKHQLRTALTMNNLAMAKALDQLQAAGLVRSSGDQWEAVS